MMKIPQPTVSFQTASDMTEKLRLFLEQPTPEELAVCPGCKQHLSTCSASCMEAPQALSMEPEKYPIEKHVVPLVFEIMATRVLETCWSCEGHMDKKGNLWKLPQVCFYSPTEVYVKLLYLHLAKLNTENKLNYPWHIVITDFAQNKGLTYSIQPDLNQVEEPHLGKLQMDLQSIAKNLSDKLKFHARNIVSQP